MARHALPIAGEGHKQRIGRRRSVGRAGSRLLPLSLSPPFSFHPSSYPFLLFFLSFPFLSFPFLSFPLSLSLSLYHSIRRRRAWLRPIAWKVGEESRKSDEKGENAKERKKGSYKRGGRRDRVGGGGRRGVERLRQPIGKHLATNPPMARGGGGGQGNGENRALSWPGQKRYQKPKQPSQTHKKKKKHTTKIDPKTTHTQKKTRWITYNTRNNMK